MNADARDNPSVSVRPPRRCRWSTALGLLMIFASGVAVGWALPKLLPEEPRDRSIEGMRDRIIERIDDKVGLTDRQIEPVRKIVEQRLLAWRELRKKIEPEMKVQMEQMNAQIAALLDDDQKPRWAEYYAEMCARWQGPSETQPSTSTTSPAP